jgi:RimJ/RimL family protein N-acetyltransferase
MDATRLVRPDGARPVAVPVGAGTGQQPEEYDQPLGPPVGLERLVIVDASDEAVGEVQWHPVRYGPTRGSVCFNIGISIHSEHRGKGHGTRAQRLLAQHLFAHTAVARIEAGTDVDNFAEQRALEAAGFQREGILRSAQWRAGEWRDMVWYAVVRNDW